MSHDLLFGLLIGALGGSWGTIGWHFLVRRWNYRRLLKAWGDEKKPMLLLPPSAAEDAATKGSVDDARLGDLAAFKLPGPVTSVPTYGRPAPVIYRMAAYEEPMRCAGESCDHHELTEGEAVQRIPVLNGPEGADILVCLDCAIRS